MPKVTEIIKMIPSCEIKAFFSCTLGLLWDRRLVGRSFFSILSLFFIFFFSASPYTRVGVDQDGGVTSMLVIWLWDPPGPCELKSWGALEVFLGIHPLRTFVCNSCHMRILLSLPSAGHLLHPYLVLQIPRNSHFFRVTFLFRTETISRYFQASFLPSGSYVCSLSFPS